MFLIFIFNAEWSRAAAVMRPQPESSALKHLRVHGDTNVRRTSGWRCTRWRAKAPKRECVSTREQTGFLLLLLLMLFFFVCTCELCIWPEDFLSSAVHQELWRASSAATHFHLLHTQIGAVTGNHHRSGKQSSHTRERFKRKTRRTQGSFSHHAGAKKDSKLLPWASVCNTNTQR